MFRLNLMYRIKTYFYEAKSGIMTNHMIPNFIFALLLASIMPRVTFVHIYI